LVLKPVSILLTTVGASYTGRGLGGKTTLKLGYRINPSSRFTFQFDSQHITDSGGDCRPRGIMVLGLRTIFRFQKLKKTFNKIL
jgi:hypothetical protein